jgi:hypothetical protein
MTVLIRLWVAWTASFLAFPLGGLAGRAIAGLVDNPRAALIGGVATGLVTTGGFPTCTAARQDAHSPRTGRMGPHRERVEMSYEFEEPFIVDSGRIQTRLGVAGTPLDQALAQTLDSYRASSISQAPARVDPAHHENARGERSP